NGDGGFDGSDADGFVAAISGNPIPPPLPNILGKVTPDSFTQVPPTYFGMGADYPAGTYRVGYVSGAFTVLRVGGNYFTNGYYHITGAQGVGADVGNGTALPHDYGDDHGQTPGPMPTAYFTGDSGIQFTQQ